MSHDLYYIPLFSVWIFLPFPQSSKSISLCFWLYFSCRYAWFQRPIHQVTHHPESLSGCLYFPENQPDSVRRFGVWPRARLSFLSVAQSSKLEPSQISKRSRSSLGRNLLFFVGLKWQCQVSLNRWVWQSGWPGAQTQSCSKRQPEMLHTNLKMTLSSVDSAAELRFSSPSLSVCVWQALREKLKRTFEMQGW